MICSAYSLKSVQLVLMEPLSILLQSLPVHHVLEATTALNKVKLITLISVMLATIVSQALG